jgi:hypothetical protein
VFTGHILNPGFMKSPGCAAVYPGNRLFDLIMVELYIMKVKLSIPISIKTEQIKIKTKKTCPLQGFAGIIKIKKFVFIRVICGPIKRR